jgi:alpha-tubulin suppressor-like RCC1 family protein
MKTMLGQTRVSFAAFVAAALGCSATGEVGRDDPAGAGPDASAAGDGGVLDAAIGRQDAGPLAALGCLVFTGGSVTCLRRDEGTLACWGMTGYGQAESRGEVVIAELGNSVEYASVTAGRGCAIRTGGELWCWGSGFGAAPVAFAGLDDAVHVAVGAHACVARADGTAWCWGGNEFGQLGDGTTTSRAMPVQVVGIATAVEVSVGTWHSCARGRDGEVWCWGRDLRGQLGDGIRGDRSTPARVVGVPVAAQLASGHEHACARGEDGSVWCWGLNGANQGGVGVSLATRDCCDAGCGLGDVYGWCALTPVRVPLPAAATDVVCGDGQSCALLGAGELHCWGENTWGQVGADSMAEELPPTRVETIGPDVAQGSAGNGAHTCARTRAGELYCWGSNLQGELGVSSGTGCIRGGEMQCSSVPQLLPASCIPPLF